MRAGLDTDLEANRSKSLAGHGAISGCHRVSIHAAATYRLAYHNGGKMPNLSGLIPQEYNCVVQLDPTEEKTAGGIILPSSKTERDELAMDEGTLVAVSAHAFTYADWPKGARKPQPGDRVLFARYSGAIHERHGHKFRILKDQSIVAVVEPTQLSAVA